jgi:ribose 5-phosphate isomerase A
MNEKQLAAEYSVNFIEDGMTVGLGTGSTVAFMIKKLSGRIKEGLKITAVSTSEATAKLADSFGIKITALAGVDEIDITIDGADEVDENLNGIKGGGGALLHEKIIASNSKKNIWIVDSSKLVKTLGRFPLPVEVIQFGSDHLFKKFVARGYKPSFRMKGESRLITDEKNFIIDLNLEKINDPQKLDAELKNIPGVVETGLFYNITDLVVAGAGNEVKIINKKKGEYNT